MLLELLLPHELKRTSDPASASEKSRCFQCSLQPPKSNFCSNTRRSPTLHHARSKTGDAPKYLRDGAEPASVGETRAPRWLHHLKVRVARKQFRLISEKAPHPAEWLHPLSTCMAAATAHQNTCSGSGYKPLRKLDRPPGGASNDLAASKWSPHPLKRTPVCFPREA